MYRTPGEFKDGMFVPSGPAVEDGLPSWSTSDAKAFELVDEVLGACPSDFALLLSEGRWIATFGLLSPDGDIGLKRQNGIAYCHLKDGSTPTRPEAICRAYLAAMEWMKARKA